MQTNLTFWLMSLLLAVGPLRLAAVDGDLQPPCWRGQADTTRQHWRFDTDASPAAPEMVSNPAGTGQALISPNANAVGWVDTTCAWLGIGCDPGSGDVDPYGSAQGYWDLGGTNSQATEPGTVLLSFPSATAAGATRYVWAQATVFIESGFFAYPTVIVSNAVQVGGAIHLLAENPTNSDGNFTAGAWFNQQTLWSLPATGAVTTVLLRGAGVGTLLDTVVVDTMHRTEAGPDVATTPQNTATNLSAATLLVNDGGPTLNVVGVSSSSMTGGTVTLGVGVITYTPPVNYTGSDTFYYTNSDCAGGLVAGQVTANVVADQTGDLSQIVRIVTDSNDVVVTFAGTPGQSYRVEAATNFPSAPWLTVSTNVAATNGGESLDIGQWQYRDANALLTRPSRFYRSVRP